MFDFSLKEVCDDSLEDERKMLLRSEHFGLKFVIDNRNEFNEEFDLSVHGYANGKRLFAEGIDLEDGKEGMADGLEELLEAGHSPDVRGFIEKNLVEFCMILREMGSLFEDTDSIVGRTLKGTFPLDKREKRHKIVSWIAGENEEAILFNETTQKAVIVNMLSDDNDKLIDDSVINELFDVSFENEGDVRKTAEIVTEHLTEHHRGIYGYLKNARKKRSVQKSDSELVRDDEVYNVSELAEKIYQFILSIQKGGSLSVQSVESKQSSRVYVLERDEMFMHRFFIYCGDGPDYLGPKSGIRDKVAATLITANVIGDIARLAQNDTFDKGFILYINRRYY